MKTDNLLKRIKSPVIFAGDANTAYRDPAAVFCNGVFHLYFTLVKTEPDGVFLYTAQSESTNLTEWTEPEIITVRDKRKNFSSPGNAVWENGVWNLCLQTYCRENGEKYGNENCRLFIMKSRNLRTWSAPELMRVKGTETADEDMGRMIDPYLVKNGNTGKWLCFYKQNGISCSQSENLKEWSFLGNINAGENPCVIEKDGVYYLFHSPPNGIGIMKSNDLLNWHDTGRTLFLGQREWQWARGRITAGMVLDCRRIDGVGKYLMFFHGSGPEDETVIFDNYASIGIAWSDDLLEWSWPR